MIDPKLHDRLHAVTQGRNTDVSCVVSCCREACTSQEASGTAPSRIPAGGCKDGVHHSHSLRYHQGGSATVVTGEGIPRTLCACVRICVINVQNVTTSVAAELLIKL